MRARAMGPAQNRKRQMQFNFTNEQATYLLEQVESNIATLHNHIATAVEDPAGFGAKHTPSALVTKLRRAQDVAVVLRRNLRAGE